MGLLDSIEGLSAEALGAGIGFGLGIAAAPALAPLTTALQQTAFTADPNKAIDAMLAAAVAAENYETFGAMATEATNLGYNSTRFQHLYDITVTAPGFGTLIQLLRRQSEQTIDFSHGLRKAKLEPQWDAALANLANQRISATDLAYMMVRGVIPDDGLLGMSLPTHADNLQLPPQLALDPVAEAALTGWDRERLAAMTARSGLAMAPVMAAQANFRKILTDNDYLLTIARGDLFPAYADPVREVSRAIPSPLDGTEGHLRGWLTQQGMYDITALHGMTPAHTDLLYSIRRRPLSPHQIKQALARGGTFDATQAPFPDPYTASVHEANLGPEWYDLAIHLAGAYPSIFQTNRLVTGGTISAATGVLWLQRAGMADEVVTAMETSWGGGTTAATDKDVTKAQVSLWGTTHTAYKNGEIGKAAATANLTTLGKDAATQTEIFTFWDAERATIRHQLSVAQLQKAEKDGITNPATGQPFTRADVITALEDRGYDTADATVLASE